MKLKINATTVVLGGLGIFFVSKLVGGNESVTSNNSTSNTGTTIDPKNPKSGSPLPFSRIGIIIEDAEGIRPVVVPSFQRSNSATSGQRNRINNTRGFRTF